MKNIFRTTILFIGILFTFVFVDAYQVESLPWVGVERDFILGPGRTEIWARPGETAKKHITVTNRIGERTAFKVQVEDFTGSRDLSQTVVLLGDKRGPYSLRDWVDLELDTFVLNQGERITFAVNVSIPEDVEPGGHYGAIIVSTEPMAFDVDEEGREIKGGVSISSRIGSLFFVRVEGDVDENGYLKSFSILKNKMFFEKGPIDFQIVIENEGSVHLVPYGLIEIRNILGRKIDEIEIDPFFSMPDSLRSREIKWDRSFLFGRYKATLYLNRGYKDIVDEMSVSFWVVPYKILIPVAIILILIIGLFVWILKNFEIRKKNK